ncbi:MAG: hypothetical protein HY674_13045 [Chloroflexi bacterium]|nr:hypothetical protein [Chloroflexota bacterium]
MQFQISRLCRFFSLVLLLMLSAPVTGAAAETRPKSKPVLLYSRYFNAAGEGRYLPDGTYKEVMQRLREEFDVRAHKEPLTRQTLAGVGLLLIANPSDQAVGANPAPPHISPADIEVLTEFVGQGGGLILMENQEGHNLEVEDCNRLLARFGIQATNLYTDTKKLVLPKETPLIGGLRWAYYTGNLLRLDASHPAKPRAIVTNDLAQKPITGTRDQDGVLLAVAEPGQGRVVVVTDSGWLMGAVLSEEGVGGVTIKGQDNWEIFRRLAHWAAHSDAAAGATAGK